MVEIAVPKYGTLGQGFNVRERTMASESAGRPWNRMAGGWISDLAASMKFIMLCPFCVSKFNPRKNQYEPWRAYQQVVGKCDGCNQVSTRARGYIHQSNHQKTGEWERKPRRGRWSLS